MRLPPNWGVGFSAISCGEPSREGHRSIGNFLTHQLVLHRSRRWPRVRSCGPNTFWRRSCLNFRGNDHLKFVFKDITFSHLKMHLPPNWGVSFSLIFCGESCWKYHRSIGNFLTRPMTVPRSRRWPRVRRYLRNINFLTYFWYIRFNYLKIKKRYWHHSSWTVSKLFTNSLTRLLWGFTIYYTSQIECNLWFITWSQWYIIWN